MNISEMIQALKEAQDSAPKPFDTPAEVLRIEGDTAWVQIPGSDDETPVNLTIAAKEGDTVQVRVSGGTAFLVGNATAPPTDDKKAINAQETADEAQTAAEQAQADINEQKETFWHDDNGAHILGSLNGYRNDLKSDGMHIVQVSTDKEVAKFAADACRIGEESWSRAVIDNHSLQLIWGTHETYFHVSNLNDASASKAHVRSVYIGDGSRVNFRTGFDILGSPDIISVTVNGVAVEYSMYEDTRPYRPPLGVKIQPAPAVGDVVVVDYYTRADIYAYTFGSRESESITGAFSISEGINNEVTGSYSKASGYYLIANGEHQTCIGKNNVSDIAGKYAFIIGNGTGSLDAYRSNAFAVQWDGTVETDNGTKELTAQTKTTTWSSMTASGATKTAGGFFEEGKHVYVSLQCSLNSAGSSGDNITLFTGLPEPLFMVPLEVMVANQRNGVAWINDSGELHFRPTASVSTSNTVIINGHYTSA